MAKAKQQKPTGWRPIEVGTNRNGMTFAPIRVGADKATAAKTNTQQITTTPQAAATPAKQKES